MSAESISSRRRQRHRASSFAFIRAEHDLAAVHAYLHRYRDRPVTLRAYTRELERLILWSVVVRRKPLSSMMVEDCEAFKDFLVKPLPSFTGPKCPRSSGRWRPFAPEGLSPDSQAYAVRVIRAAFAWLVEVRYLAGNPWSAVHEPATVIRESAVQVHRALPATLWAQVRAALDERCSPAFISSSLSSNSATATLTSMDDTPRRSRAKDAEDVARQWRAARAAILLMGDSGLRRVEAAQARRERLRPSEVSAQPSKSWSSKRGVTEEKASNQSVKGVTVWTLTIVGKRRKQRTVPVSSATLTALRAHWADRGRDFDAASAMGPLISPLWIPATDAALERHDNNEGPVAYTPDALGRLVHTAMRRLAKAGGLATAALKDMTTDELVQLVNTSAHAFRHTFGTRAVARDMPTDVVQAILGHASLQTTSIYVRVERRRMLEAAANYYAEDDRQS